MYLHIIVVLLHTWIHFAKTFIAHSFFFLTIFQISFVWWTSAAINSTASSTMMSSKEIGKGRITTMAHSYAWIWNPHRSHMTQLLEINFWFFFHSSIMKCLFTLFAFFNGRSQLFHPHRFTLGIFSNKSEAPWFALYFKIKRIFIFMSTCKNKILGHDY